MFKYFKYILSRILVAVVVSIILGLLSKYFYYI